MLFCPFCGTLLLVDRSETSFRYYCGTCCYVQPVRSILTTTTTFDSSHKRLVATADADAALEGGQIATTRCESGTECAGDKAYYVQMQMRSADEPPTTFYKCITCGFQWRQD